VSGRPRTDCCLQLLPAAAAACCAKVFLPLALTAAARMLEPVLSNSEASRVFVEHGGADVLLKLHQLPKLTPAFNFSSASHSLLSVFRALSGTHGQAIAGPSKDAVATQLAVLLPIAQAVGPVCVPTLPAEQRTRYIKQLLVVQGLVALTSAVARNVPAMLPQASMGSPPLLASMGKLERLVMAQAVASDPWKAARDAAKKEAAPATAAAAASAGAAAGEGGAADAAAPPAAGAAAGGDAAGAQPPAVAGGAAAGAAAGAPPVAAVDADAVDVDAADAYGVAGDDDDVDGPVQLRALPAVRPGSAAAASSAKQKRTPEDIAYEALSYTLTSLRTFYMGTAKAVHTPARRRDEQASVPTVPMKAAALNLALLLAGNLQLRPWQQVQGAAAAAAAAAGAGGSGGGDGGSSSAAQPLPAADASSGSSRVDAAVAAIRARSAHYLRLTEELYQVLIDSRRRHCHLLVLNYFSALGGMKVLATSFHDAAELLWELIDAQQEAARARATAAAAGDQPMTDAQPSSDASAAAGGASQAPPAPAAASTAAAAAAVPGVKDPKQLMETVLVKMLSVYEQLATANLLLAVPQVRLDVVRGSPAALLQRSSCECNAMRACAHCAAVAAAADGCAAVSAGHQHDAGAAAQLRRPAAGAARQGRAAVCGTAAQRHPRRRAAAVEPPHDVLRAHGRGHLAGARAADVRAGPQPCQRGAAPHAARRRRRGSCSSGARAACA
jgi:hypothetical protein